MDYLRSFAISAAGMNVQRARVDVAALNLANAHTARAPGEAGYQPLRAVAMAGGMQGGTFPEQLGLAAEGLALEGALPEVAIEPSADGPRLVHEPGHPFADARGFVAYPSVDAATEMVTLMSAMRAYEANVAAMNTARTLATKTLEIGGAP